MYSFNSHMAQHNVWLAMRLDCRQPFLQGTAGDKPPSLTAAYCVKGCDVALLDSLWLAAMQANCWQQYSTNPCANLMHLLQAFSFSTAFDSLWRLGVVFHVSMLARPSDTYKDMCSHTKQRTLPRQRCMLGQTSLHFTLGMDIC